ncbi:hypothetical protein [Sphingomonas sp. Leaf412]|uniref:hypothetical protein n=1 Tax=Sphingomonas sp. Leaf412 TaxID=1736370 RepID=UPI001F2EB531|nr:hypothetical protein [Sphingomonas sp. Leaf412]
MRNMLAAMAVMIVASPLAAQQSADPNAPRTPLPYDRGYDKDQPRTRAINDAERPEVQEANDIALAQSRTVSAPTVAGNAANEARYAADVAAYRVMLRQHRRDVRAYARQEGAYAQAMADWRAQVDACDRGNRRACDAPTPDPMNYM